MTSARERRDEQIPLAKLQANIAKAKQERPTVEHRFVALVATGSFAPPHLMHFEMFEVAKRWLEEQHGFTVVVGWISPSHDHYVSGKMRSLDTYPINSHHRVALCRIKSAGSDWIETSSFEAEAEHFIDFPIVALHHAEYLDKRIKDKVTVMYLGGADLIAQSRIGSGFCFDGGRKIPGYMKQLQEVVDEVKRVNASQGLPSNSSDLYIALSETLNFSSTKVRHLLELGKSVAGFCGDDVETYLQQHDLHKAFLQEEV